jgi:hypothetical protein
LAAAFIAVSAGALAHELDHQFHKHDAACALHFFSDHSGKGIATAVAAVLAPAKISVHSITEFAAPKTASVSHYLARGPPLASEA